MDLMAGQAHLQSENYVEDLENFNMHLEKQNSELIKSLEAAENTIKQWKETASIRSEMLKERHAEMEKLKKRIAQMKGSKKIQEEIFALKAKRAAAEKNVEEEVVALRAKHAEAHEESGKELQEREKELELVEDGNEEGQ
ncbi:hypothetical protein QM012_005727 [Aureobasidium pullulans]|uniref:Nuf2 DHR10-like domain-containing protein n=1 Tax=Aureobasidium pullulans TaxID=5580 RepID=A0ABR0TQK0_AURPU